MKVLQLSGWPEYSDEEIESVSRVLLSGRVNYWTGVEGQTFEREFAALHGRAYGIAVANGTLALEMALRSLGIAAGDEVIVPSRTFIATASAVVAVGGIPVVADVDPVSGNVTYETLRKAVSKRTGALIAVHLAGWPCDMDSILKLANEYNLKVIEDCAQAHGATYRDRLVGTFGDAAAFSFCQDKIMSTGGEGGMFLTDEEDVWERAWSYKDHGKNPHIALSADYSPGFRWLHDSFGTNWRMTEMQAAIGRIQLNKLFDWVAKRRRNAAILSEAFRKLPLFRVVEPPRYIQHAYYKYYVFLRLELLSKEWSRDRIIERINRKGVPCFQGGCSEIYQEKAFRDSGLQPKHRYETARILGETSIMFQVHPTLGDDEMAAVCNVVEETIAELVVSKQV